MEIMLTKDSDALICLMYKGYCNDRKAKITKDIAKNFGNSKQIHERYVSTWMFDDCLETCRELHRAGLIDCEYGDGDIVFSSFTDLGIIYMEGRFSRNVQSIIDYLKTFKDIIPFI